MNRPPADRQRAESSAKRPSASGLRGDGSIWLFVASGVLLAGAVAFAGGWVPAPVLGGAVAAFVLFCGWQQHRVRRRQAEALPLWREAMPCYLSVQDRDLRILDINALFRRDLGDRIGEHCYAAYKRRDTPCPDCPVLKTFEDGEDHSGEETIITEDGEVQSVVVTSTPLRDDHGQISAVMEMSTNITEVKTLRQELDQTRQHFQQLFDIVPCYITVHDRDFNIVESNRLFRQDFGDCRGGKCHRAYKGRDRICPDCPVEKTFEDGEIHSSEEVVTTRDGRQAQVVVYSMPVRDEDNEIRAVMEVSTNITKVKELQRQLAMVGLAVTGMAHRIKNVLMGLEGGIFVVNTGMEEGDQETLNEGWEMVQRNVAKVSRLAKDLLFCSKERLPKLAEGVSPKAIAAEVHDLYRRRMAEEEIELVLDLPDEDDAGTFDAAALQNLMENLVSNAMDACRFDSAANGKQHRITLRCGVIPECDEITIEVSDNGAGIPEEDSHRMFESFFSTKGTEGTGLGLFVVQKVVSEHGGTVSFDTAEGEGTAFRVTLPRVAKTY